MSHAFDKCIVKDKNASYVVQYAFCFFCSRRALAGSLAPASPELTSWQPPPGMQLPGLGRPGALAKA